MRVYFIFPIKDEFRKLYKNREVSLYQIFLSIYKLSKNDARYGFNLLNQMVNVLDKDYIDRDLFVKNHSLYPYSRNGEIHIYNQLYKNEVSRMIVRHTFIRIETDKDTSSFFDIIKKYSNNLFVCDFKNIEYFYI